MKPDETTPLKYGDPIREADERLAAKAAAPPPEQARLAKSAAQRIVDYIYIEGDRYKPSRLAAIILEEFGAAPQGDFRAGVAACVEKVKAMRDGWEYGKSAADYIIAQLESIADSAGVPEQKRKFYGRSEAFGFSGMAWAIYEGDESEGYRGKSPVAYFTDESLAREFLFGSAAAPAAPQQKYGADFGNYSTDQEALAVDEDDD